MRGMRKKLNTFMLQLPIYYIYLYWGKCGHCNNEAREIDCLYCRKVDAVLIASAKILEYEEASRHAAFMGNSSTVGHMC